MVHRLLRGARRTFQRTVFTVVSVVHQVSLGSNLPKNMTNRQVNSANTNGGGEVLPRPVAVVPVAKPRGKLNTAGSSHVTTSHYVNQGAVPKSPPPRNSSPGDTDTMTKTKAILNEAADAVAKSFAKQTQGINKGKVSF